VPNCSNGVENRRVDQLPVDSIIDLRALPQTDHLEILGYTKRQLKALLTDERFWMQPRLPITKRRIISQISNSRADESDIVLITAYNNDQLIAYVGILPDIFVAGGQVAVKFGWLTTWWVDKASKHRMAATRILFAALKSYANKIAISSFSDDAKRAYDATKRFQQCARFDRVYFVLALPPSIRVLSPLTKWVAGAKNRIIFARKLQRRGLEIRTADSLSEDLASFINTWALNDPLARDSSYWCWILEFPWLSASAEDEATQKRYAFSVFAKDFRQIPMVVYRHCAIIAVLFMTLRDGRLSLKYAYYDSCDVADVAAALQAAIADINPWLFISADTALNTELKRGFPFYLVRRSKSSAIYSAKALPLSVGCRLQLGTGDSIFT
jgi:hypothetical protein